MGRNGWGMKSVYGDIYFKISSSTIYMVCSFPIAMITEYHKFSDLKHSATYSLRVLEV